MANPFLSPFLPANVAFPWFGPPIIQRVRSAATDNATLVKAGPSMLQGWYLVNKSAAPLYLKFFDKVTVPLPSIDAPLFVVTLPPSASAPSYADFTVGVPFQLGFGFAILSTIADFVDSAVAADDVHGMLLYS